MHASRCIFIFTLFLPQDYFRDLTVEDFQLLVPELMDPSKDDAFTVPFLGRERSSKGAGRTGRGARAAKEDAAIEVRYNRMAIHDSLSFFMCHVAAAMYAHDA